MRTEIAERMCDYCGTKKQDNSRMRIGGSCFHGWLSVVRENGSSRRPPEFQSGPWDFCSPECMQMFFMKGGHNRINFRNLPLMEVMKDIKEQTGEEVSYFTFNPRAG